MCIRDRLYGSWITVIGLLAALVIFLAGYEHPIIFFGCMIWAGIGNGMVLPNANAGLLSVRPSLAGSASGIGGAIMLGFGALFAYLAGFISTEDSGAYPLIFLMVFTSIMGVLVVKYIIFLEQRISN